MRERIQHYWTVTLMTIDTILSDIRFWQFTPICLVLAFLAMAGLIWRSKNP